MAWQLSKSEFVSSIEQELSSLARYFVLVSRVAATSATLKPVQVKFD